MERSYLPTPQVNPILLQHLATGATGQANPSPSKTPGHLGFSSCQIGQLQDFVLVSFFMENLRWCHFTRNATFGASRESRHASRIKKRNGNTNKLPMLLTDKRLFPEVSERYPYHFYEWIWVFPWREARTPQEALGLVLPCQFHLGRSLSTGKQRCG